MFQAKGANYFLPELIRWKMGWVRRGQSIKSDRVASLEFELKKKSSLSFIKTIVRLLKGYTKNVRFNFVCIKRNGYTFMVSRLGLYLFNIDI